MSTRKIKNARDLESNELIYFKSHAQATFMSDGSTVEDVINEIKETGGGSSNANVQAVETGDVLDDVNVDYATTAYVDDKVANISLTDYATITYVDNKVANISLTGYATTEYVDELVGDINSILENIINGGGGVTLIVFTIDGTEYQAEEGMTWEEWCSSGYNTDGYHIDDGVVYSKMETKLIDNVTPLDIILNNGDYVTSPAIGGVVTD